MVISANALFEPALPVYPTTRATAPWFFSPFFITFTDKLGRTEIQGHLKHQTIDFRVEKRDCRHHWH